jgi:hypothetical protein
MAQDSSRHESPTIVRLDIAVPDKVSTVSWVVGVDVCTIQIDFWPMRLRLDEPTPEPPPTETEIWLLTADGSTLSHGPRLPVGGVAKSGDLTYMAIYEFPCSAATEITAVVVRVDNEIFVDAIRP